MNRLVDAGNSVTVIEHNLDVIKTADWIIDIGPDGGPKGGRVIATGKPEEVAKVKGSETGRYLAPLLKDRAKNSKSTGRKSPASKRKSSTNKATVPRKAS